MTNEAPPETDDVPTVEARSADLSDEQIKLAENLGSFLWESSTLRHGLFTPPEFSRLVRGRIKQYFYEQNAKEQEP